MSFNCFGGSYATNLTRTCATQSTSPIKAKGNDSFKASDCLSGVNWFQGNTQHLNNLFGGLVGNIGHHSSTLGTRCGTSSVHQNVAKEHCGSNSHGHTMGGHHSINSNAGLPDNTINNETQMNTEANLVLAGNQDSSNSVNASPIAIENANSNSSVAQTLVTTAI